MIPAYNEQRFIAEVLKRLPNWVDCVVVVDDASTDATVGAVEEFRRCQARGEGYSGPVELVSHSVNRGVGAAIVSGYRRALSRDVDCMVVMGGDAQMSPEDLPAVVEPIVRGEAHYVKGNRFAHRRVREMPRLRRWGGLS